MSRNNISLMFTFLKIKYKISTINNVFLDVKGCSGSQRFSELCKIEE
jgi:hypothetical protein